MGDLDARNPQVSVLVPVYNTACFLERCVESILAQTNPSFELLLVDDGSTDGSGEICDSYALRDGRVRAIHQENKGVSAARNRGLTEASGEYVWFCDSDDWAEPRALEVLVAEMERAKPDMVVFSVQMEDAQGHPLGRILAPRREGLILEGPLQCGDALHPYAHFVRKSAIGELRFSEDLAILEDREFFYKLFMRLLGKVTAVDDVLYHYLVTRVDSAINRPFSEKYIAACRVGRAILLQEAARGCPMPAYDDYARFSLGVLGEMCKNSVCLDSFDEVRQDLLSFDEHAESLTGKIAAKYWAFAKHPKLARAVWGAYGKVRRGRRAGSTIR